MCEPVTKIDIYGQLDAQFVDALHVPSLLTQTAQVVEIDAVHCALHVGAGLASQPQMRSQAWVVSVSADPEPLPLLPLPV